MIFIGIVIFTIYTKHTIYMGSCDPQASSAVICADVAIEKQLEEGRYEGIYVGEFDTIEACRTVAGKAIYKPKDGERVGDITQILCVPKNAPR